jgi:hypothetical protein
MGIVSAPHSFKKYMFLKKVDPIMFLHYHITTNQFFNCGNEPCALLLDYINSSVCCEFTLQCKLNQGSLNSVVHQSDCHEQIKGNNYKNSFCVYDHTVAIYALVALYDFNSRSDVVVLADDSEPTVCCTKTSGRFSRIHKPSTDFIHFICSKV